MTNNLIYVGTYMEQLEADRDEARRQLAEAAACVLGLIAWGRHVEHVLEVNGVRRCRDFDDPHRWWDALPAWLRREIEK